MAERTEDPVIRFIGYTTDWKSCKLGELSDIKTGPFGSALHAEDYVKDGIPIITTEHFKSGSLPKTKMGLPQVTRTDYTRLSSYVLSEGDIVFSRVGSIDINALTTSFQNGWLFSGRVLRVRPYNKGCSEFLHSLLENETVREHIRIRAVGQTMPSINTKILSSTEIFLPINIKEQVTIGSFFRNLDNLISLHQKKHTQLITIKKAMLEKMFPKEGETVPEIRFAGFTESWEQYRFSNVVQIERGGSPRPIDDYITESPDGLNWVKIGDAPELGHYIIKTAEKIRPEGLQNTREVHPGDLILSNSMSFGKPYIMGIDGCIHDGWLLIRDTNNRFDLIFLCHLLSTPQMIEQYKAFAAGSTVNNLNKELVGNTIVTIPKKTEQKIIGQYFEGLDTLLTLQQKKIDQLQHIKKAFLDKMFV